MTDTKDSTKLPIWATEEIEIKAANPRWRINHIVLIGIIGYN
jgi:hypothetical protein